MYAFFQSVGIVLTVIVLALVTIAILYLSYILAIGILIASLVYITYSLLTIPKSDP